MTVRLLRWLAQHDGEEMLFWIFMGLLGAFFSVVIGCIGHDILYGDKVPYDARHFIPGWLGGHAVLASVGATGYVVTKIPQWARHRLERIPPSKEPPPKERFLAEAEREVERLLQS